jgi:hypothetical protein
MSLRETLQKASAVVAGELQRLETGRSRWTLLREPERRKYLHRLHDALADLERIDEVAPISDQTGLRNALTRLASQANIPNDELWAILNETQLARIRHGDAETVCALIEDELQWHRGQTSWLTWDALYPDSGIPPAVIQYRGGGPVDPRALASARNMLLSMYRTRHDDEVARRARGEERAKNLQVLAILLALLLSIFVIVYSLADGGDEWEEFAILISAGGAGAAISGTIKARDRLTRQGDIHRFRDALPAQLLVGAATALFVYLLFQSDIITFGNVDLDTNEARAAIAFLAGFSEPWVLRTIERATQVGSPKAGTKH